MSAPVGDRVIEGYVDLLVEGPDGLVVIDYKTDSANSPAEIDANWPPTSFRGRRTPSPSRPSPVSASPRCASSSPRGAVRSNDRSSTYPMRWRGSGLSSKRCEPRFAPVSCDAAVNSSLLVKNTSTDSRLTPRSSSTTQ